MRVYRRAYLDIRATASSYDAGHRLPSMAISNLCSVRPSLTASPSSLTDVSAINDSSCGLRADLLYRRWCWNG